jgi:hypothetical protein
MSTATACVPRWLQSGSQGGDRLFADLESLGPDLAEEVSRVPDEPGVYLWKDTDGAVLYVGKAKSLRKRMKQYVLGQDDREKVPLIMAQTTSLRLRRDRTEVESLILEKNLIRQFAPPYNVDYRDDKSYPFIAVTVGDPFPAIKFTREKHRPGTRYFGPYTDARAARETVDIVRRIYPICSAQCVEWKRLNAAGGEPSGKACFDYNVGKGPGPCVGAIDPERYASNVAASSRSFRAATPVSLRSSRNACVRPLPISTSSARRAFATGSTRCGASSSSRRSCRAARSRSMWSDSSARRQWPGCTCSWCGRGACSSATSSCSTRGSTCR